MTHLSPGIRNVEPYPFEALDRRKADALASGRDLIDFGVGDPREVTAPFIREAFGAAIEPISSYPRAAGLPELRGAIAGWLERRFQVTVDADTAVLPLLGSKEIVFSLAQAVLDPAGGKDLVIVTAPGYTIPERGARFAGGEVLRLPLTEHRGFLPDLDSIDDATWERAAILWLNYPNNPTGAVAPLAFFREAAERCRAHDVLLASDEAYSELWFDGGPPASALQVGELANVLAVNTLSKRSSMTGYRSGFAAGDPDLIAALKALRPSVGVTPQEFVQRASVAAWNDEAHVEDNRRRYATKRAIFLDLFARRGVEVAGSEATFYLWVKVPGGEPSLDWAITMLERGGLIVAPGSFFGPEGEGYVRMAMVPTVEECERAAGILDGLLQEVPRVSEVHDLAERIERSWKAQTNGEPIDAEAVETAIGLLDRGEIRVAEPDGAGGWTVNQWVKQAVLLYFRVRGMTSTEIRALRVPRQAPPQARLRRARRAGRPAGHRSVRRVPLTGGRADAQLRQHRRLGGPRHHGRHMGHRRLVRPDRGRTCTWPAAWASAEYSNRCRPPRWWSRTARSSGRGASSSKACGSALVPSWGPAWC